MSSQKLERLLKLIAALLDTSVPLTADTLHQRIDGYPDSHASFRRAFERDKELLREMGVPLDVVEVPGIDPPVTGYRIHRDEYSGRNPDLAPDELAALHLAANLVRVQGISSDGALQKLGGVAADSPREEPIAAIPSDPHLAPLFSAATEQRLASFRYRDADRSVEVHQLMFTRGQWYVSGYDRAREGVRLFRVDRIDGDVVLGPPGAFTRPADAGRDEPIRPWALGDDEPIDARLLVDADQALWATHALGPDAVIATRPDGSVVVALTVRNRDAFRSFVLSFLEHAEVLSPAALRLDVVAWLEAMAS